MEDQPRDVLHFAAGVSVDELPPHRRLYLVATSSLLPWRPLLQKWCEECCGASCAAVKVEPLTSDAFATPEASVRLFKALGSAWVLIQHQAAKLSAAMTSDEQRNLRNVSLGLMCGAVKSASRCLLVVEVPEAVSALGDTQFLRELTDGFAPPPSLQVGVLPTIARALLYAGEGNALLVLRHDEATAALRPLRSAGARPVTSAGDEPVPTEGDLATYQERVFNSDPDIRAVRYDYRTCRTDGAMFVRTIQDAVKWNVVAHTLDLRESKCTGPVLVRALRAVLHTNRYLRSLDLDCCSIDDPSGVELARVLADAPHITSVALSRNPGLANDAIVALGLALSTSTATRLHTLDMSLNNSIYTERTRWSDDSVRGFLRHCGGAAHLRTLLLRQSGLTAANVLDLCRGFLSPKREAGLGTLDLSGNAIGDVAAAAVVDAIQSAEAVNLAHCGIGHRGLRAIAAALCRAEGRAIHSLDLAGSDANPLNSAISVDNALKLAGLNAVDLRPSAENDSTAPPAVYSFHSARVLNVIMTSDFSAADSPASALASALAGTCNPVRLDLARCSIGDDAMVRLCESLLQPAVKEIIPSVEQRGCGLTWLSVADNVNLTEDGCAHKVKELLANGFRPAEDLGIHLEHFDVSGTCLGVGERAILAMFENRGNVQSLGLARLQLLDGILVPFATLGLRNPLLRLHTVDLSGNPIRIDGLRSLCAWVRQCPTVVQRIVLADIWESFTDAAGRPTALSRTPGHGAVLLAPLLLLLRYPPPLSPPPIVPDIQQAAELVAAHAGRLAAESSQSQPNSPTLATATADESAGVRIPKSSPIAHYRMQLLRQSRGAAANTHDGLALQARAGVSGANGPLALRSIDLQGNDVDAVLAGTLSALLEESAAHHDRELLLDVRRNPCAAAAVGQDADVPWLRVR
jgi:hypothetical protein